MNIGFKVM